MRSRKTAASGPTTSILPSVEPSNRPTRRPGRAALARDRVVHRLRRRAGNTRRASIGRRPRTPRPAPPPSRGSACARIGIEQVAARGSGEGAEGHRRIGRAEGREPDLRDRLLLHGGGDGERVHVGELALIGRHAGRGVALDVLDRAHALLHRELRCPWRRRRSGNRRKLSRGGRRAHAAARRAFRRRPAARPRRQCVRARGAAKPAADAAARPAASPSASASRETEGRVAGAGGPLALHGRAGQEDLQRLVEGELAARLREEMHRGRPAAGHQKRVAGDRPHAAGMAARAGPPRSAEPARRPRASRPWSRPRIPAARAASGSGPVRLVAQIGDERDRDAGLLRGRARRDRRCHARSRRRRARRP